MFAGVFGDDIFIRLTPADQTEVKKLGAKPFDPLKRGVMKNYLLLRAHIQKTY